MMLLLLLLLLLLLMMMTMMRSIADGRGRGRCAGLGVAQCGSSGGCNRGKLRRRHAAAPVVGVPRHDGFGHVALRRRRLHAPQLGDGRKAQPLAEQMECCLKSGIVSQLGGLSQEARTLRSRGTLSVCTDDVPASAS